MRYLVNDCETVGLNVPPAPASGVVEVAWAYIDPVTLEIQKSAEHRVNPGCPIDPGASAIHGITDADVAHCPPLKDVYTFTDPVISIGHNTQFDVKFLGSGYENLVGQLCTLALSRQYVKGTTNHKLPTLVAELGLEAGDAHTAMGDIIATISLLRHIIHITGRTLPELVAAARKPKVVMNMPFGSYRGQAIGTLPSWYITYFDDKEIDQDLRYSFDQVKKIRGM